MEPPETYRCKGIPWNHPTKRNVSNLLYFLLVLRSRETIMKIFVRHHRQVMVDRHPPIPQCQGILVTKSLKGTLFYEKFDPGSFVNKQLSDDDRLFLLQSKPTLPEGFVFPQTNNRRFNPAWERKTASLATV